MKKRIIGEVGQHDPDIDTIEQSTDWDDVTGAQLYGYGAHGKCREVNG